MICITCGNKSAYMMRFTSDSCGCDRCLQLRASGPPSVYFRESYLDPNLINVNRPHEKDGVWVTSKRHKAALMKELRVHEAGDKRHGARTIF